MKSVIFKLFVILSLGHSIMAFSGFETPPLKITFANFDPVFFLYKESTIIMGYSEEHPIPKELFSIPILSHSECKSFASRLGIEGDFLNIYFDPTCKKNKTTFDSTKILLNQLILTQNQH